MCSFEDDLNDLEADFCGFEAISCNLEHDLHSLRTELRDFECGSCLFLSKFI